ncbi:MAG: Flagellar biosynthetic protein FliR [bacterium ADurb.Bin429]|nr:MAG: Flagellar biosynthetic protein FliR [bacterium ADurb.Bin429]
MGFFGLTSGQIVLLLLIFARVGAISFTAPVISSPRVPPQIKAGLGLALSFAFYSVAARDAAVAVPTIPVFVLLLIKEVVVGLVIGYAASLLFNVVQMAGEIQDNQAGFSFAGVVDPNMGHGAAILGQFQMTMMWLIFFAVNGHLLLIRGIGESFLAIPVGSFSYDPRVTPYMFSLATTLMMTAIKISAPIICAVLLADLAMGMLQRTAPQLNLIAVGFQIKIGVAVVMLLLALPLVAMLQRDLIPFNVNVLEKIFSFFR